MYYDIFWKLFIGITCRRNLAGDVNGILKVHKFLEKQGLINCIIDPSSKK
jgi:hypothetical protein